MRDPRGPRRLGEFLPGAMRAMGLGPAASREAVREAWRAAAGGLADRANVWALRNGILTLSAESPAVRFEIEVVRQHELLPRLRALLPGRPIWGLKCVVA